MALETHHPRNLDLASDTQMCVRIIPPHSSHWKPPPENKATSGAFDDQNGEVSVDLFNDSPTAVILNELYKEKIQSNGVGMACAVTSEVRAALVLKEIEGNVWQDPIDGNQRHGIITGEQTKKKKKCLSATFSMVVAPKNPQEVFGN